MPSEAQKILEEVQREAQRRRDYAECEASGLTPEVIEGIALRPQILRFVSIACLTCWVALGTVWICLFLSTLITGGIGKPISPEDLKGGSGPDGGFYIQLIALLVGVVLGFGLAAGATHPLTKGLNVLQRRRAEVITGVPLCFLWAFLGAILGLILLQKIGAILGLDKQILLLEIGKKWPAGVAAWVLVAAFPMAACAVGWMAITDRKVKRALVEGLLLYRKSKR